LPLARPVASPSASPGPSAGAANPAAASFSLQSPSFVDGGTLPTEFTCDGSGQSPPLAWSGAPPGTAAYALVVQEADAPPVGNVAHPITEWLLYNMPLNVTQLPAGVPPRPLLTNGSQQGLNSQQTVGYLGPCPGHGDPPHHVTFQLLAQDGYVTLETAAVVQDVQTALNGHTVGQALLTATFQR